MNKNKTDHRSSSKHDPKKQTGKSPIGKLFRHDSASSTSAKSSRSQLVDLVVEDQKAEEIERVRARKEGSPAWNEVSSKHFV